MASDVRVGRALMSSSQSSAPERQQQDTSSRRALPVSLSAALDGLPAMRSGLYVARVLREMVQPMLRLSSVSRADVIEPVCRCILVARRMPRT
jgi:hypothetical protein